MGKKPDADEHAERALQFDTEPAVEPEGLEPLPSDATTVEPEDLDLEHVPSDEIMAEDSHQPDMHLDDAGNEPHMPADTDNPPDVSMDRPLRVTFGKELIRCRRHRDGTLQSVPLSKVGPNTRYPSSLKGTHRRVHGHYHCKDLTSTAEWAAAYREDPRTKHIFEVAIRSPAAQHQLRDAKLSFDDGKFFHLSTMGKCVIVPRTRVTSIMAMYHESEFYGHSGVLRTMALIKRDYVCSHFRHCVERYILSSDVCQAAKSRRVDTARVPRPLLVPDTKWHSVSIDWVSGLPPTTRRHDAIMTIVDRFSKRGIFIPIRKDMTAVDLIYVLLREVVRLKGCPRRIVSDRDKLFGSGLPPTTRRHDAIMTIVDRFSKRGMFIPIRKDMTAVDFYLCAPARSGSTERMPSTNCFRSRQAVRVPSVEGVGSAFQDRDASNGSQPSSRQWPGGAQQPVDPSAPAYTRHLR